MRQVIGLQHLHERRAVRLEAQRLAMGRGLRRLAHQRLEQPTRAHVPLGHAHQHGHDLVGAQRLPEVGDDRVGGGLAVLEQGLHQVVVEVGQRLQHLGAGGLLALAILLGQRDGVGGPARLVGVGLLGHEVDVADEPVAAADGVLVRHDRAVADVPAAPPAGRGSGPPSGPSC